MQSTVVFMEVASREGAGSTGCTRWLDWHSAYSGTSPQCHLSDLCACIAQHDSMAHTHTVVLIASFYLPDLRIYRSVLYCARNGVAPSRLDYNVSKHGLGMIDPSGQSAETLTEYLEDWHISARSDWA